MKGTAAASAARVIVVPFVAALLALLAWSAQTRAFDPDEFQHLQMAWLIGQGQVPYRDFFEHHTPLYHLTIAPWLVDKRLTTDGDAAVGALIALRWLGIALCTVVVAQTYLIARRIADPLAASGAALLLAASAIFAIKGIEIRPDQLAAILLLGPTLALVHAEQARRPMLMFALAGAAAMLAILTTQKIVFAVPGLAVTFVAVAVRGRMSFGHVAGAALAVLGGAVAAAAPMLVWFASQNAIWVFVVDNFLLGASWPRDMRPLVLTLSAMLRDETLFVLLAALGVVAVLARGWWSALWPLAVVAPMISMVVLMPLFPVVQPQYLFLWLPYAAVLGGIGAAFVIRRMGPSPMIRTAVATLIGGAVALHGALAIKTQSTAYEQVAFDALRYTVTQTPPDSTVLRAWSPGVAFRRPAFFYFSLHPEIRSVVPQAEWRALETGLRSGRIAPELVEMDAAMRAMPPEIVLALKAGWAPTGTGNLWRRKTR